MPIRVAGYSESWRSWRCPLSHTHKTRRFSGTVTDTTGGVLPGVTVTAVNEALGQHV